MSDELYFDVELKKCLNTAAFSDDLWDWWYQRIHQAHDASVDRVTDTQRAENAKLRELAHGLRYCSEALVCKSCPLYDTSEPEHCRSGRLERELGIEED